MFALLAVVALAGPAQAHAALVSTSPVDRSEVAVAPDHVEFVFNEPVSAAPGALRVHDSDGNRVDDAIQQQPTPETMTVGLPAVPDGGYLATYLVTSADGHVVRGAITFQVGQGQAIDDATVAALFAGGGDAAVVWSERLVTVVQTGAALVALGALVPLLLLKRRSARDAAAGRAGLVGADPIGTGTVGAQDRSDTAVGDTHQGVEPGPGPSPEPGPESSPEPGSEPGPGPGAAAGVVELERDVAAATVRTAALWGIGAALVAIPLHAMAVSGLGLGALASLGVLGAAVTSSVGLANLTLVAGLLGLYAGSRGGALRPEQLGASALLVAASFLLAGHTMTASPTWLMLVADFVHVMAAGVWAGGLVVVVRTWRRADAAATTDRADVASTTGRAAMVARFSGVALWSMLAVALAGGAMTWALARQPRALVSTDWGWTLVVKLGLVAILLVVAAYNRFRLLPAIERTGAEGRAARAQLTTTMRVEGGLLVAILVVTAILTGLRPAAAEAGIVGAFDTVVAVDDSLSVNLVVDPNRAGANQVHVYLLDDTGRPTDEVDEVTLELHQVDEDIGPIVRTPAPAGPGHWILAGNDLAIPGPWRITVVIGVDRFTEQRAQVDVVVNG